MNNPEFRIGEAVTLAHGGQPMTVEWIEQDSVHCTWIYEGTTKRDVFHPAMLRKVQTDVRQPLFVR